jgi:hypothetical protein
MKANISQIVPGKGLGDIQFGMLREDVQKLLGDPDEVETQVHDEEEEDITEAWHYDELEVSLSFEKVEDWRLCTIAVSNEDATLEGHEIIGLSKSELLEVLKKLGMKELTEEDWSSAEAPDYWSVTSEADEMVFWIEDDVVMDIQWGPLFVDEDTINWPINGHFSEN